MNTRGTICFSPAVLFLLCPAEGVAQPAPLTFKKGRTSKWNRRLPLLQTVFSREGCRNHDYRQLRPAKWSSPGDILIVMLSPRAAILLMPFIALAQAPETVKDLVDRLSPEQKQQFQNASKAFNAEQYADAFATLKQMLTDLKGDPIIAKFASEAAINTGDPAFAITTLRKVSEANPEDWQATALLTRACAELGDSKCRDTGMAHMQDLHNRTVIPPNVQQYILERIRSGQNTLVIRTSLAPWGPYQVYDLGQVLGPDGKTFLRITLEHSDSKNFSFDSYKETGLDSAGQRTQAHYTFQLLKNQPPYDIVRSVFISIAEGTVKPLSSRTGLLVK